ncbi:hypothetical protein A2773_04825 [Candidatus Gottesmanbacteria bacterium RIFCSPHIGHO2_01_FULL_39_10]|uniref:HD domain-containing protein n=1 Tax=Candidatus Gottesmanbacteria bacterium RIFCSPHIGHO2_01_FULL_39_10 TaxID=1798375 RepID=A0A1F5ZRY6_9BACT|nr:MAG: hypothetical protein A2773_04825 [Candidatus Gottesmanbacteria bacterium RIFCSPHIGHO2_01_FULL_39_10]
MITRTQAWELLNSHMKNKNLIRHCLSVEAVMKALANHFGEDEEVWGIVGLLHDGDYEAVQKDPSQHTLVMSQWLKEAGETDQRILDAIMSHNFAHTGENPPKNNLEWSLHCCDELTGLIVAVALVRPDKKLSTVTVDSVLKKYKIKQFAAGAKREDIEKCEEKLGIKLPDFIDISLKAMQSISTVLGL